MEVLVSITSKGLNGDYDNTVGNETTDTVVNSARFLELGTSVPHLSDYGAYDETTGYDKDAIISFNSKLYVSTAYNAPEFAPGSGSWRELSLYVTLALWRAAPCQQIQFRVRLRDMFLLCTIRPILTTA